MLFLVQGGQQAFTRGVPSGFVPEALGVVNQSWGFLSIPLLAWFALNAVFLVLLRMTPFGRRIYAVGSNEEAARLSGLSVHRVKIAVYILASCLAVISGVILTGYVGYVDRFIVTGLDLDSVAAAVWRYCFLWRQRRLAGDNCWSLNHTNSKYNGCPSRVGCSNTIHHKRSSILAAVSLYGLAQRES